MTPAERIKDLEGQLRHMAQTAHQAYHTSGPAASKSWEECPRAFCRDAVAVLSELWEEWEE